MFKTKKENRLLEIRLEEWGYIEVESKGLHALDYPSISIDIPTKAEVVQKTVNGPSANWATQKQTRVVKPKTPDYWPTEATRRAKEIHEIYLQMPHKTWRQALYIRYVDHKSQRKAAIECSCSIAEYYNRLSCAKAYVAGWLKLTYSI